jgi:hypothetical protein
MAVIEIDDEAVYLFYGGIWLRLPMTNFPITDPSRWHEHWD